MHNGYYFFNQRTVTKSNIHNQKVVPICGKKYPYEPSPSVSTSLSSNLTRKETKLKIIC